MTLPKSQLEIVVPKQLNSHIVNELPPPVPPPDDNEVVVQPPLQLYCCNETTSKAEILWILKVDTHNYSLPLCDDIPQLFKEMFRNSQETESTALNKTKARYLLIETSGPYFYNRLTTEIRESKVYYSLIVELRWVRMPGLLKRRRSEDVKRMLSIMLPC